MFSLVSKGSRAIGGTSPLRHCHKRWLAVPAVKKAAVESLSVAQSPLSAGAGSPSLAATNAFSPNNKDIVVEWSDGSSHTVPLLWLANNSFTSDACNLWTGQKLNDVPRLLESLGLIAQVAIVSGPYPRPARRYGSSGQLLQVRAGSSEFLVPIPWMEEELVHKGAMTDDRVHEELRDFVTASSTSYWHRVLKETRMHDAQPLLWDNAVMTAHGIPEMDWEKVSVDPASLRTCLGLVRTLGFVLIRGAPVRPHMVKDVVELFGFVRPTVPYGEVFDVRSEANAYHMANTNAGLELHSDNPYRLPVPTIQALHCMENAAEGGDSTLTDAWAVAQWLQREEPRAFELLANTLVGWGFRKDSGFGEDALPHRPAESPLSYFRDAGAWLADDAPLIELDASGKVKLTRFNARSMTVPRLPSSQLEEFYEAYALYSDMMTLKNPPIHFRLQRGDVLIFDNTRLLHGRTAFKVPSDPIGVFRHLQGCYTDADGLRSTHRTLTLQRDEQRQWE